MTEFNPMVNISHTHQDVYGTRKSIPNKSRYRFAESLLLQSSQGLRLLEVGGGMAEFSCRLAEKGFQVTFSDLNTNSVSHAQKLGFDSHQIDFNFGLPNFSDAEFDAVVMLEVIEHIVNAEHLLLEVRRVLKQDGLLVLSTPNFVWWYNRLLVFQGKLTPDEGYHYRFFTKRTLEHKLITARLLPEIWKFSSPAFGLNKLRRVIYRKKRKHVLIPKFFAALFAQTIFVRARAVI